nr:uncharacterized protein LOC113810900 [Penaeus vannamei]
MNAGNIPLPPGLPWAGDERTYKATRSQCMLRVQLAIEVTMVRNVAVTSLLVALCLVAAVAGHSRYGIGGYGGGVLGGVHGSVLGGVHGSAIGGVHGGGVHGLGLVGSGIHGAGSFNTAHYPGPLPGYSFCDQRPVLGYNSCKYWSHYTSMNECSVSERILCQKNSGKER